MITDGRTVPVGTTIETDICVVGAGPAGLAIALRLTGERRLRVCLLESGDLAFDGGVQVLAQAESRGLPYFPIEETRIRCFGGTTLSWGGVCAPFDEIDFEARSWVPDSGWPFSCRVLDDYLPEAFRLCELEKRHTDEGPPPDGDVQELPDAGDSGIGGGLQVAEVFLGPPTRFGRRYRDEIRSADNVTVYLNTTATALELGSDGAVSNLRVGCLTGSRFSIKARNYVLAGGGIENPRLLLASNSPHVVGIGNAHDLVGRFFMEHPRVVNRFRVPSRSRPLSRLVSGASGTLAFSRLTLVPRVQRDEELLHYHANLKFGFAGQQTHQWQAVRRLAIATRRPWRDSPFFQDAGGGRTGIHWTDIRAALARPDRSFLGALGATTRWGWLRRFVEITSSVEQRPEATNRVELVRQRDALGVPRVRLHWSLGEAEERTYRRGVELVLVALERLAPGIGAAPLEDQDQWPSGVIGTWHHMGTTRMHDDPRRGVVDSNCRVHGVENLFIAGSSVFATGGSVSPTLTILALSTRLADHLRASML